MRPSAKSGRRSIRHTRIRERMEGTAARPRLVVYRSLNHIYAQLVDDSAGRTLAAASTTQKDVREKVKHGGNKAAAAMVGGLIAKRAVDAGIKRACFDRAGFKYHGCVAAVADAARKAGLEL